MTSLVQFYSGYYSYVSPVLKNLEIEVKVLIRLQPQQGHKECEITTQTVLKQNVKKLTTQT